MSDIQVIDTSRDVERDCDSIEEAEATKADMVSLGADPTHIEIRNGDSTPKSKGNGSQDNEVVETRPVEPKEKETQQRPTERDSVDLPQRGLNNPLATLPDWMLTEIQHGRDTSLDLNKDGSQVIANALGLSVEANCEVSAMETDFEYCRYRAVVETPDGKVFNAVGDARIDEEGKNHDKWDLERKAETRAKKRAVKWATGGGIEAFREYGGGGNATE